MGHERLKHMKESLMSCIENQMCNIYEADATELGCAVDMLKDLEEALYYCTITEAMEGKGKSNKEYEYEFNVNGSAGANQHEQNGQHNREHRSYNNGGRMYMPPYMNNDRMYSDGSRMYSDGNNNDNGSRSYYEGPMMRDEREGRSPEMRRMYMEAREKNHDKSVQMHELEKYMQELSQDVVEMIQESSTEEKQYLEKKLLALASRIGQMK